VVGVRAVNVATPATAAFVFPVSVTVPSSLVAVTVAVDEKRFPNWSRISMTGWTPSATPVVALAGWVRMRSAAAYGATGGGEPPVPVPPLCVVPRSE
jgi:hypothetical protein